jgi:hypothetical protein
MQPSEIPSVCHSLWFWLTKTVLFIVSMIFSASLINHWLKCGLLFSFISTFPQVVPIYPVSPTSLPLTVACVKFHIYIYIYIYPSMHSNPFYVLTWLLKDCTFRDQYLIIKSPYFFFVHCKYSLFLVLLHSWFFLSNDHSYIHSMLLRTNILWSCYMHTCFVFIDKYWYQGHS